MRDVAGMDGCRGGWVVVRRGPDARALRIEVVTDPESVFADPALACIGIDVPIGLLDAAAPGGRACDRAARAMLGPKRASSVFSAPVRDVLAAADFADAAARSRRSSSHQLALSRQGFAIVPKIAEVDARMTPARQQKIVEVHPECCFAAMNGGVALVLPKKRASGRAARTELMRRVWGIDVSALLHAHRGPGVQPDDVLDAMAACWTAERVARGVAQRLPAVPEVDRRGLRMEIWW